MKTFIATLVLCFSFTIFAQSVPEIAAKDVGGRIQQTGGIVVAYLFDSSCPACKQFTPQFAELIKKYPIVNLLVFSVDEYPEILAKNLPGNPFASKVVRVKRGAPGDMTNSFGKYNIPFPQDGYGVPYVIILNRQGKSLYSGNNNISGIEEAIKKAKGDE